MIDCYEPNTIISDLWLDARLYIESTRVIKITELQEGVEYYDTFCGVESGHKYKVENKELIFYNGIEHIWVVSTKPYNEVIEAEFEPCEWMLKSGDVYYYPSFTKQLVGTSRWDGFENELAIKRNVGVYRTEEEAIAKAKELGWT
jgi:hypothetical protein